ncbi:hypothetical protein EBT25_14580 [bacterium]|nr:hypothetical protein [bacterium]
MTENQIYFIRGCCTTILAFAATGLLAAIFLSPDEPNKPKDKSKFEVIDTYKNCNVIRYTDPTSRWHYFLRCST